MKKMCHPLKGWIQVYTEPRLMCRIKKLVINFFCICLSVLQAEAWIKSKLWDLKDGGNIQCCPLQDWDKAPQILCTDFKDFENRMVQLNQVRQGSSSEMGASVSTFQ